MNSMPHKNIDIIRSELMQARIRKTTFTSIEALLIAYTLFWLSVFILTDNYNVVSSYTILGEIFTKTRMILLLGITALTMIIAGFTRIKWLRALGLFLSTCLWIVVSSSILLEALNTRSSTIVLAFFSAKEFIDLFRKRWSL